ncbi:unnamed protein product [Mytilus coruscus]|uniref:Tyr recombinase domain-containing protein n=1 Tax=Mytilus coruscus TaxID=42192 RepID=A0A6J8C7L5_MYTCO|nr:unnamed protein product [Mytilus coruscus]
MVQIPAQSLVAGFNQVHHGTATYKPIGRPLYNKINSKLQEKIKNKKFIDMSDILVDHHPAELDFHLAVQNKRVGLTSGKKKKFVSIESWTDAFSIFSSVLRKFNPTHPTLAENLAIYMDLIRQIQKDGGDWYFYDVNFRQSMQNDDTLSWSRTVFENSPSCSTQTVLSSTSIPATELLEYVTILANAALAPSTQATYSRAWKTFDSFCTEIMNQSPQPPRSVATISLFIAYIFKKSYAPRQSCRSSGLLRKFKHNVRGMPKTISFSHGTAMESAVVAMVEYLKVRPYSVPTEPLFCSVDATPLHRPDFDRILHKCLASCGLDSSRYKGHSFRIGAATDAAERGLSDSQIRSMGRWKSNAFQKYIRSHLN